MSIPTRRSQLMATTVAGVFGVLAAGVGTQAYAQAQPAAAANSAPTQVTEIVVTGSSIKRVDRETASPVQVINAVQLQQSGYDTISGVLMNITANGQGTLSSNNSEAFAGAASGVALRGLTVGDTLVLIDGHRMAPYPLSDDGERQFVDINAIPFDAVDHVEVLKDGASAVYGSDAIAGVVNIILKKNLQGFQASAEGGTSQHGGGATQHYTLSLGKGDLSTDGYNAYISAEYRSEDAVYLSQRSYQDWAKLNYTSIGGNNLEPGASYFANGGPGVGGLPATLTPYLVNATPGVDLSNPANYNFLGSGCNFAKLTTSQCTFTPQSKVVSPTQNFNVIGSYTKRFDGDGDWEMNVKASFFDSKGQQSSSGPIAGDFSGYGWANSYPGAAFVGGTSNPVGGQPVFNVGYKSFVLPAGFTAPWLSAPIGAGGAYLEGVLPQLGIPTLNFDSQTFRLAADVTGEIAGWDVRASFGLTKVETRVGYENFVNYDNLGTDLLNGSFNPLGGNSAAVMKFIAPTFSYNASDSLNYVELNASRKLLHWDGGDLSLALGAQVIDKDLDNPGASPVLAGDVLGTFSTYAIGRQTDSAGFAEVDANLWRQLELNAALRDDYYDTYGNSLTPKFGAKWRPNKFFALRGTYSEGFRAPTAAETGTSSTLFGLGLQVADPVLCGTAKGQVPGDCQYSVPFDQTTNNLKPETSKSFTGGFVVEPIKNWSSTFDYYHITIKDQIITAAELSNYEIITPSGGLSVDCTRAAATAIPGVATGNFNASGSPITTVAVPNAGPIFCYSGYVNANQTTTSGFDIQSQYKFNFFWDSRITTSVSFTHMLQYDLINQGVIYHLAGTHGPSGVSGDTGNPRDRANVSVSFDKGPLNVTATGYWISSFSVTDPSVSGGAAATCESSLLDTSYVFAGSTWSPSMNAFCRVKAFTNINLVSSYKLSPHITLKAEIDNLLDANAPQDMQTYSGSGIPYNPEMHGDGVMGRYFKVGVSVKY